MRAVCLAAQLFWFSTQKKSEFSGTRVELSTRFAFSLYAQGIRYHFHPYWCGRLLLCAWLTWFTILFGERMTRRIFELLQLTSLHFSMDAAPILSTRVWRSSRPACDMPCQDDGRTATMPPFQQCVFLTLQAFHAIDVHPPHSLVTKAEFSKVWRSLGISSSRLG